MSLSIKPESLSIFFLINYSMSHVTPYLCYFTVRDMSMSYKRFVIINRNIEYFQYSIIRLISEWLVESGDIKNKLFHFNDSSIIGAKEKFPIHRRYSFRSSFDLLKTPFYLGKCHSGFSARRLREIRGYFESPIKSNSEEAAYPAREIIASSN